MNSLLKKKIANYDFSLKFCESEQTYLRSFINKDDSVITERNKENLLLQKKLNRRSNAMLIGFPVLGAVLVGALVFILIK
jgi:hypothetical protein